MEKALLSRLESLRINMIRTAQHKGLTDPDVIRISQEIDQLHNKINKLKIRYPMNKRIKIIIRDASIKREAYIYAKACV